MKRKVIIILIAVIVLRLVNNIFLNNDPVFYLSPRNFNGRGLISMPSLIDFIIPLIAIFFLFPKYNRFKFNPDKLSRPFIYAFILILTPIITGSLLYNYIQKSSIGFDFDIVLVFRYLLFIITFVAINVFADSLQTNSKKYRFIVLFIFLIFIGYTQDMFASGNKMYVFLGLINSVGVSTVFFSVGMRKNYKNYPIETIISISIIGIVMIFFKFNVLSVSYFTIFLPFLSFFLIAIALHKNWKLKTKLIVVSIPFIITLFLNWALPKLVSPSLANELIERKREDKFFEEKIGDVVVKYKNKNFKNISLQLAKVIDEANKICNSEFGISPNVKQLVLKGIAPGGFHAEFPDKIVGNITSEIYLNNCIDSSFLNDPLLSPDFPDPVNAILHEYSHLFGVITYHKWWPGAEEEGWATYSATRIAKLLYDKTGPALWQPAYDYSSQADKITKQNLSGKAVTWSHPNEYGGFNLWYHLGKKSGLKKMYNLRWQNSRHDIQGSLFIISNPKDAKKIISVFGAENFKKYNHLPIKIFQDIYSRDDYLYMANTMGIDTDRITKIYNFMKMMPVDPSVPIP
jgi:hypothetical protein